MKKDFEKFTFSNFNTLYKALYMRNVITTAFLLLMAMNMSFAQLAYSTTEFKRLHGLTGLWKMDTQRGTLYEEWNIINDNQLAGRSYKIRNNDTLVLENVVISLQGNTIFYAPVVHNQNNEQPVPFKLISCTNNRYVFENKEHDYPQRVIYDLASTNDLRARIEGSKNGKEMGSDFIYNRIK
jgi:hypothetical protein